MVSQATLCWGDPLAGKRGHNLITQEAIKDVLPIRAGAEDNAQQIEARLITLKLFSPYSNWTWYVTEFDPEDGTAFGLVDGFEREWGYFNIFELAQVEVAPSLGPGLKSKVLVPAIERDLYWKPITVRELENQLGRS